MSMSGQTQEFVILRGREVLDYALNNNKVPGWKIYKVKQLTFKETFYRGLKLATVCFLLTSIILLNVNRQLWTWGLAEFFVFVLFWGGVFVVIAVLICATRLIYGFWWSEHNRDRYMAVLTPYGFFYREKPDSSKIVALYFSRLTSLRVVDSDSQYPSRSIRYVYRAEDNGEPPDEGFFDIPEECAVGAFEVERRFIDFKPIPYSRFGQ